MPVTFWFDLGSPYAYLAAERIERGLLPGPVHWQPVLLGGLFRANGRSSWGRHGAESRASGMREVERRARAYELPPVRWPEPWPGDMLFAMRVAVHAQQAGAGREFALAAFRTGFVEGRDLGEREHALAAAAAVGLDPRAAEAAGDSDAVKAALRSATEQAHRRGVVGVPTVEVGTKLLWGDDRLDEAAALARAAV